MPKHEPHITINQTKCTPCSELICIGVCPQGILEQSADRKPCLVDEASCTQCGVCANLCPSNAIEVKRK